MNRSGRTTGPERVTTLLISGTLVVAVALTSLLIIYDITTAFAFRLRTSIGLVTVIYLIGCYFIVKRGKLTLANWLLIGIYQLIGVSFMLVWGIESAMGIIAACFTILLPGILLRPRHILGVTLTSFILILAVYGLHLAEIVKPLEYAIDPIPTTLELVSYFIILSAFALASWTSSSLLSKNLDRAQAAEQQVRRQKNRVAKELDIQTMRLRQAQLKEIHQLYKFAVIGQSMSATLHELSNHLSILNLDIEDMAIRRGNANAIKSAQQNITHINTMVRKTRAHLDRHGSPHSFNVKRALNEAISDALIKRRDAPITISKRFKASFSNVTTLGHAHTFIQAITILFNNAADACRDEPSTLISVTAEVNNSMVSIIITDNGPGISKSILSSLFEPMISTKPGGLGVGLYIAKHVIESLPGGSLALLETKRGASFQIKFKPSASKDKRQHSSRKPPALRDQLIVS